MTTAPRSMRTRATVVFMPSPWPVPLAVQATIFIRIFTRGPDGRRPVYGSRRKFQEDPYWRDLILFHEYFDGDTGEGLGASHQTGWTGLVASLIDEWRRPRQPSSRLAEPAQAAEHAEDASARRHRS